MCIVPSIKKKSNIVIVMYDLNRKVGSNNTLGKHMKEGNI